MALNYNSIRNLLTEQIQTVENLPLFQAENTRITPIIGQPWCRLTLLPAEPNPLTVGPNGLQEHQGLAQLDLFFPSDFGAADSGDLAVSVMEALPRGYIATDGDANLHVRNVYPQTAYAAEGWYVLPVVIRWSSFALAN